MDKVSSNRIIKVGIVTHDAEDTARRLTELFNVVPAYDSHDAPEGNFDHLKSKSFKGQPVTDTPMKVKIVYLEPIYFEIVQPIGDCKSPWHEHLKQYGTSVCFFAFYIEGFEQHIDMMGEKGYPLIFQEEKGYERYAYFDTMKALGFTLEMKERIPKQPQ